MDINQIKKYLPLGWDVVDLIDHGIIDLDIVNYPQAKDLWA